MEMSAIAAKNVANMAYHDWMDVFYKTKIFEPEEKIKVDNISNFERAHDDEL